MPGIDIDGIGIGLRPAAAGAAAVVAGHGQMISADEVKCTLIEHIIGSAERRIDLGNASGKRHGAGPTAGHRHPANSSDREHSVVNMKRGRQ